MVYFVGAGTGAADLITVRGMRLLQQADVIIYAGSLVNPELLAYAGENCEIHNSARLTLAEAVQIMRRAEKEHKMTVRLHTGDPSVYGAVREQMDELDKLDIPYESCPGVSACFGAAASLNLEYTLPNISQSLIITRMEGKTKVPEKESIERFAAHHASMAVYLSAGMTEELSRRLIAGGYRETTPAAIVYKATWDEEEAYICTVETLHETAVSHGIAKTALVLVGDAIAHQNYHKSRLYAPDFATAFRPARTEKETMRFLPQNGKISVISFTQKGWKLAEKIRLLLKAETECGGRIEVVLYTKWKACPQDDMSSPVWYADTSVSDWAKAQMQEQNALLFIGACGIAVRAIAPHIKDKLHDAPVLVMDEMGRYVIPILSGHMGGANELARYLAQKTGAEPVMTTATDINGKFAVDLFAKRNRLFVANKNGIAAVSAKALAGEEITISMESGRENASLAETVSPPQGVYLVPYPPKEPVDVIVTSGGEDFGAVLLLRPREYVIGIGCKKGKSAEEIEDLLIRKMKEAGISTEQVFALASIANKQDEQGIAAWSRKEGIPFLTYSAEELQKVKGNFAHSDFVENTVGVDNVCERAALRACEPDGKLIMKKYAENGMTMAIAKRNWTPDWERQD